MSEFDFIDDYAEPQANLETLSDNVAESAINVAFIGVGGGGCKIAKAFLDLGFYISFSGIVTFPKAHEIHECAKIVPNDKYLIETDSPFLAPVPHRGKRNEPAFVENVANFMADLRSTELITIARESSKNAEDLFKFDLLS